jgi:hypothetical protein
VVLRGTGLLASVGELNHSKFRSFENERRMGECKGFVDGDLIEMFLDIGEGVDHCLLLFIACS